MEPICAVLAEHGVKIAPSTYYEWSYSTNQDLHGKGVPSVRTVSVAGDLADICKDLTDALEAEGRGTA